MINSSNIPLRGQRYVYQNPQNGKTFVREAGTDVWVEQAEDDEQDS